MKNGNTMTLLIPNDEDPDHAIQINYPTQSFVDNDLIVTSFKSLYRSNWGQEGDPRTSGENEQAEQQGASLLFGEILPSGVSKLLDKQHLDASTATTLVDLGCGMSKLILQSFLEYPNLNKVVGIELCRSRFLLGVNSLKILAAANPSIFNISVKDDFLELIMQSKNNSLRILRIYFGTLFNCKEALDSDIVICQTNFPSKTQPELIKLLSSFKINTRILLYHTLRDLPGVIPSGADTVYLNFNDERLAEYKQIAPMDSHFPTTWSPINGAHFDCWLKLSS